MATYGFEQYISIGAEVRATSNGGAIYGLPNRWDVEPETEARETDRKASKLTAPNADSTAVRLAQYVRISGLLGVCALTKPVTARGTGTRNVPDHLSGLCPDERCNFVPEMPDALTQSELRFASRYRESMKGEKFAQAMIKAKRIRDNAWFRNAFPYWPIDKAGRKMAGIVHKDEYWFDLGGSLVSLRSLYEQYKASEAQVDKDAQAIQKSRASELAALIKEQQEDAKRAKRGKL